MASPSPCSFVTDVTGPYGVERRLTVEQYKFLRFFLDGPPDRAFWLRQGQRIAPVAEPFAYHSEAQRVLIYRLDDGRETFRGDARGRTTLNVAKLRALEDCWEAPLQTLNPRGEALARREPPAPPVTRTFKLPHHLDRALEQRACIEGTTVTGFLVGLVESAMEIDR